MVCVFESGRKFAAIMRHVGPQCNHHTDQLGPIRVGVWVGVDPRSVLGRIQLALRGVELTCGGERRGVNDAQAGIGTDEFCRDGFQPTQKGGLFDMVLRAARPLVNQVRRLFVIPATQRVLDGFLE